MKLETFFEKFELFAEAPNAVAKMRELILTLAVQGKLLPQDPNDEPAEVLLEKVRKARRTLANNGDVKTKVQLAPIGPGQEPYSIPETWVWVPLNELTELVYGKLLPTTKLIPEGFQVFGANGIIGRFSNYLYEDEMLLISCRGAYSGTPNISPPKCYVTNNSIVCEFFDSKACDIQFFHAVISISPREKIVTGSAQPQVTVANAIKLPVPLPPLAEQKRIVAKVDELMALCDQLDAQQKERAEKKAALSRASLSRFAEAPTTDSLNFLFHKSFDIAPAELRKSILTIAVRGKLVPQDPMDEPAEELLEKIAKQRAKLLGSDSLRKTKPCRQFTSDEAPNEIPESWAWTMLGEVTDIGTGSTPSRTEASFWIGGTIPWITSGSTSRTPIVEGDELVTPAAVMANRLRVYPPGTLLVALYGQGKTRGQVAALEIAATINQACAAVCPLDGIPPMQGYLKLLLEKQYDQMRSLSAGGAQPNLNVQKIKEVFVPLPPLAEQRRIVAKVQQLMALVDELESQLATSRASSTNLLSAIVSELTGAPRDRKVSVQPLREQDAGGRPPRS
jgi:type I restriction enzyme S subunit